MSGILILVAVIIFLSVLLNNASDKFGIPMLLAFMLLGIVFGIPASYRRKRKL